MANTSVASRLKAHISTCYLVAPGCSSLEPLLVEGVETADDGVTPLCMLPPADFKRHMERKHGGNPVASAEVRAAQDAAQISSLQQRIDRSQARLELLTAGRAGGSSDAEGMAAKLRQRTVDDTRSAKLTAFMEARRRSIEPQPEDAAAKLLEAASAAHPTTAARPPSASETVVLASRQAAREKDLLAKEFSVHERFARIAKLEQESDAVQRQAQLELAEGQQRLNSISSKLMAARLAQKALDDASDAHARATESTALRNEQRRREIILQNERDEVHLRKEADWLSWRHKADQLREQEKSLVELSDLKSQALFTLVSSYREANVGAEYEKLKKLQLEFESHAHDIAERLKRETKGTGLALTALMTAASAVASRERIVFHGLEVLHQATLRPSCLTAPVMPVSKQPTLKSVGCQTGGV
mgnify:CR=1 FL=1